jgi:hypothetical protein
MAASPVAIANMALSFLGSGAISSLSDPSNSARVMNIEYAMTRDAEIRGPGVWKFAKKRASLSALTSVPVSNLWTQQFQLPDDCLRVLMVGESWPGADLADYRTGPSNADYSVEGRNILCNQGAPLALLYVARIEDTTQFDSLFDIVLAAKLAWKCCERITQSAEKRKLAIQEYMSARNTAVSVNALEGVPDQIADGPWILARLQ